VNTAWGAAPVFEDRRGKLTLVSFDSIPFTPARAYVLSDIPRGATRGGHASRTQNRMFVGLSGEAKVTLDDGRHSGSVKLRAGAMIHVPPGTWHQIEAIDSELAVLVFADGNYDRSDYVTDRAALPVTAATASQTAAA
jgi:quercetin dioxygenase-like cupin family protein